MLDIETLRIVQASVALCVLSLFYLVTYRQTHSPFAGYWVLIVLFSGAAALLYLLNGTPFQAFANPLANAFSVLIAALAYAAARSLQRRRARQWILWLGPAAALVAGLVDDPAHDVWAGGAVLLSLVAVYLGMAATSLWAARTVAIKPERRRAGDSIASAILGALAVAAGAFSLYYAVRLALFVAVGPDAHAFEAYVGGGPTAVALVLVMVVATFAMTSLSELERTRDLRQQIELDDLTGLLSRPEFRRRVDEAARNLDPAVGPAALILADLDHFKAVNDTHGHAAGDRALRRFGAACDRVMSAGELAGRMGGEEFALFLPVTTKAAAAATTELLSHVYAEQRADSDPANPTISFGVALVRAGDDLDAAYAAADVALYEAKRQGRDRAVFAEDTAT